MKKIMTVFLALIMTLSFTACGASAKTAAYDMAPSEAMPAAAPAAMPEPMVEEAEYGFSSMDNSYSKATVAGAGEDSAPENASAAANIDPEKIIYSATANIETTEFEKSIAALNSMVESLGGFIQSSSLSGGNYYSTAAGYASNRYASYTVRIPSVHFNEIMNNLSSLGNVPYSYTYSENISAQYYDTQARLEAYKVQETRLVEMMEVAQTVEDIITIEDRLTELRYRIESLQSSLNNWDRQVSYSTIDLSIQEVEVYTPATAVKYGDQLSLAFKTGLQRAGEFFKQLLIDVLAYLPVLVFVAIAVVVIIVIVKRTDKKKAAQKAKAQELKEDNK